MSLTHKSQSALEYMMTYGWAILIIVVVAAVLYSMGIFNPSSSLSITITGFSGFSVQALCAPGGVLVMSLGNELGQTVNVTGINSTIDGVSTSNNESLILNPSQSGNVFVLGGCANTSNSRYHSSVSVAYSKPGSVFNGPYFSLGAVSGVTSSFAAGTVANMSNVSSMNMPRSLSFNKIWNAGPHYTIIGWFNFKKIWSGNSYLIQEVPGCTSGTTSYPGTSTGFQANEVEWYGGADTCTNTGAIAVNSGNVVPFNKWVMITGIFDWNGSGGWDSICVNTTCINQTYTGSQLPGGPANYSNPNPYTTIIASSNLNTKVGNLQFYDSSFSRKQLITQYNLGLGGLPVDANNLVAWFPLDGNFNDYSGNGNTISESNVVFVPS